jgi:hypothetical protein
MKMKFKFQDGKMIHEAGQNIMQDMKRVAPISTSLIVDIPNIKETMKKKSKNFLKNSSFMFAPMVLGTATSGTLQSGGLFWDTFLTYIFPWMLDIAKVYCLIRIAQAFYEEKRGGRDSGTGFSALIQHGKWYLVFWLLPLGVELIDQVASTMFNEIQTKTLPTLQKP